MKVMVKWWYARVKQALKILVRKGGGEILKDFCTVGIFIRYVILAEESDGISTAGGEEIYVGRGDIVVVQLGRLLYRVRRYKGEGSRKRITSRRILAFK